MREVYGFIITPGFSINRPNYTHIFSIGNANKTCTYVLQELPEWWAWYYWICPTAWTVNGLITSQYADLQKNVTNILPTGETSNIIVSEYLNNTFGFHTDFLGKVAAVLVVFPILFALLFIFFVKTLNFQRR